jgi:hypothetical protein
MSYWVIGSGSAGWSHAEASTNVATIESRPYDRRTFNKQVIIQWLGSAAQYRLDLSKVIDIVSGKVHGDIPQ